MYCNCHISTSIMGTAVAMVAHSRRTSVHGPSRSSSSSKEASAAICSQAHRKLIRGALETRLVRLRYPGTARVHVDA
jgi:hypothetical protein